MKTLVDYDWALIELAKDKATENSERRLSQYVREKVFVGRKSTSSQRKSRGNPLHCGTPDVPNAVTSVEWPESGKVTSRS